MVADRRRAFSLISEAHAAWWHGNEGNVQNDIGEIGAMPIFCFIAGSGSIRPSGEVGAGIRLLSSTRIFPIFMLDIAFQFADTAGIGERFGSRQQYLADYRFRHISNGCINEPNPGINFSQLYLQRNF